MRTFLERNAHRDVNAIIACAAVGWACFGLSLQPLHADEPAAPAAIIVPSYASISLEQFLQQLDAPPKDPVFAIAAGQAYPVDPNNPQDAVKPGPRQMGPGVHVAQPGPFNLTDAAGIYDRMIQRVGDLTVVAPAHMVVLNVKLGKPDLLEGVRPDEAFKLLLGALSKDQWTALESKQGLAASDLTPDEQHLMLHMLGGHGKIVLRSKWHPDTKATKLPAEIDITDKLANLHLRLERHVDIEIPISSNSWTSGGYQRGAQSDYWPSSESEMSHLNGQTARAVVPAVLKASDIDYRDPRWDAHVAVRNGITLGQLLAAIGLATHTELYCDKRMEALPITLVPAAAVQCRAGDALQAAALCVSGSYRKVGTAYVLTDDIVGLGTRAQELYQYDQAATKQRQSLMDDAADAFVATHPLSSLPLEDDSSLAITPEQWKRQIADNPYQDSYDGKRYTDLPLAELTPAQQADAHAAYDYMKAHPESFGNQGDMHPTLDGKIFVEENPVITFTLDGLDAIIQLNGSLDQVFRISDKARNAAQQAQWAKPAAAPHPAPTPKKGPDLRAVLSGMAHRALFMHVASPNDLPGIITDMQRTGLNELWLDAFSDGVPHVIVQVSKQHPVNLVARAVHLAAPHGIRVFAVADLYQWGTSTPAELADLTILGETSAEAQHRDANYPVPDSQPIPVLVSPFHPDVAHAIAAVHQQLGTVHGLAGLVWLHTESPGYEGNSSNYALGYSLPARLGFLKKEHVDPVDILPMFSTSVDTSMPFLTADWQTDRTLGRDWRSFLVDQNVHALLALRTTALSADRSVEKPLFVQERSDNWQSWYGSWDSPTAPLPRMHHNWDDPYQQANAPSYPDDPAKQAKAQSRIALKVVPLWGEPDSARLAQDLLADSGLGKWDGIAIISSRDPGASFDEHVTADRKLLALLAALDQAPPPAAKPTIRKDVPKP